VTLPDYLTPIADEAALFTGAARAALAAAEAELARMGRIGDHLPAGYRDFLARSDGLIWNGVELLGATRKPREGTGYVLPSLVDLNAELASSAFFGRDLVLGRSDEDLYCWEEAAGIYAIRDRTDGAEMARFPGFPALMGQLIRENS